MKTELTLAKIVIVNKQESLPEQFAEYYYPEVDMYLFFSECKFNLDTYTHHGRLILHDKLMSTLGVPFIPDNRINYITIDIKPTDKEHTYLTSNSRYYQLTPEQLDFIINMFDVDFCKRRIA